ncbi:hypothetical protein INT48_001952 [Thamnidium elegans]|uniref:Uncharacterized protein n=1 Tax=Thamnidium elegans TaxID=101142 RepID=A0A8H7VZB3_9FUNG|nr:hypothetical protein INT48_001952 [Thamnidium elegans]
MTNNIFVPQTFNGERMVNVNLPNRRVGAQPTTETPTVITTPTTTTLTPSSATPTRLRIAPAVIPAVSESSSTSPKSLKTQVSPSPPAPSSSSPAVKCIQKYWSEANIAILIQLHRKYFNNTEQTVDGWTQLTKEYNSITNDERTKSVLVKRWSQVMRKYNAERSCLVQQRTTQQMPLVSYWNHFQYLDGYLSHLPIPEDSLYIQTDDEYEDYDQVMDNNNKRKFDQVDEPSNERLKLLEIVLQQTMHRQQSQIDSIKTHYDDMSKMNMKFVDMYKASTQLPG